MIGWISIDEDGYLSTSGCGCCATIKNAEDCDLGDFNELKKNLEKQIELANEAILRLSNSNP